MYRSHYQQATEEQISVMRDALRPVLDQVAEHVRDKHSDKVASVVPSVDPPGTHPWFRLLITLTIDDFDTGKPFHFTRSFSLDADAYDKAGKVDFGSSFSINKSFRYKKKTGWPIAGIVSYFCADLDCDIVDMYAKRAHDAEALKQQLRAHEIKESLGWRVSICGTTHVEDGVAHTKFTASMNHVTVEQLLVLDKVLGGGLTFDFERRGLTIDQIEAIHKALLPLLKP